MLRLHLYTLYPLSTSGEIERSTVNIHDGHSTADELLSNGLNTVYHGATHAGWKGHPSILTPRRSRSILDMHNQRTGHYLTSESIKKRGRNVPRKDCANDRCTTQRLHMNILGDNGICCLDKRLSLDYTTPASTDGQWTSPVPLVQNFFASRSWDNMIIRVAED